MTMGLRTIAAIALTSAGCASASGPVEGSILQAVRSRIASEAAAPVPAATLDRCAANGMLAAIDPYSYYLTAEEYAAFKDDLDGDFIGVGLVIGPASGAGDEGLYEVIELIPGGPAEAAGVAPGDVLLRINGATVRGLSIDDVISQLRGPRSVAVEVGFRNAASGLEGDLSIVRREVIVATVTSTRRNDVGIVRVDTFSERAGAEFAEALGALSKEPAITALVIDLRGNPGGLFDQAVAIADLLLDGGAIASSVGRSGAVEARANPGDVLSGAPLAILVDRETASSAEVLAGALQDRGRAMLVGERTFGKGSIQRVFEAPGAGAVRLTTGHYAFASGARVESGGLPVDLETPTAPPIGRPPEPPTGGPEPATADEDLCGFSAKAYAASNQSRPAPQRCPEGSDCQLDAAIAALSQRSARSRAGSSQNE